MSKTILIIDSDPDTVDIVKYILTEAGYLIVLPISDDLLADIHSIRPDLILFDDWSDLISLSSLFNALEAGKLLNSIRVLIFSTTIDLIALSVNTKAAGFIKKPFDILELEQIIFSTIGM